MDELQPLGKTELSLLEEVWGVRLMAYLLACDETVIRSYIDNGDLSSLATEKRQVLENLLFPKAQELLQLPTLTRSIEIDRFLGSRTRDNQVLSLALRVSMAGAVTPLGGPPGVSYSTLESILIEMARDSYASLLPPGGGRFSGGPSISLFYHPWAGQLMREIEADPDISRLFPSDPIPGFFGKGGYIVKSNGGGGSIDQASFAETVIRSSWRRAS